MESDTVWRIEPGRQRLDLFLAVLFGNGVDAVEDTGADEDVALVVDPQRTGVGQASGIDLDIEVLGQLELCCG